MRQDISQRSKLTAFFPMELEDAGDCGAFSLPPKHQCPPLSAALRRRGRHGEGRRRAITGQQATRDFASSEELSRLCGDSSR